MRCDQIDILLDAHIDGELPADEALLLQDHLEKCSACRAELESRRALRRAFGETLEVAVAPVGLRERILATAATVEAARETGTTSQTEAASRDEGQASPLNAGSPDPRWWRRAAWPLALATAASLALVVLVPGRLSTRHGEDQPPPFTTPARVIVPRYGEKAGQATPVRFGGIDLGGPSQGSSS